MLEPCAAVIYSSFLASRPTTGTCTSTRSFIRVFVQSMESSFSLDHRARLNRRRNLKHAVFPVDVHLWQLLTTDVGARCRSGEKLSCERKNPEIPGMVRTRIPVSCRRHFHPSDSSYNPPCHPFSRRSFHHAPSRSVVSPRSVSTAAAVSYNPSHMHIRRYSEDAHAELDNFRRLIDESDDLDRCWDSFTTLQELENDDQLDFRDLFNLASRIAEDPSLFDLPKNSRSEEIWQIASTRLSSVIDALGRFQPFGTSFDAHRFRMLTAQSYCLQGRINDAQKMIYGIFAHRSTRAESAPHDIATYLHLLLSLWRFHSPDEALNAFITNRTTMAAILNPGRMDSVGYLLLPSNPTSPFAPLMEQIVLDIRHPVSFFVRNRDTWPEHRKLLIAGLVLTFLCRARLSLDCYAILAELYEQNAVLGFIIRHDVVRALVRDGHLEEAQNLYTSIDVPDDAKLKFRRNHLHAGLNLYSRLGDVRRTEELYARIRTIGYGGSVEITAVLQAYIIAGKLEQAVDLFYDFFETPGSSRLRPNRIHYTVMIAGHAQQADYAGMNEWLERMAKYGLQPDLAVYNVCLKSLAIQGEVESIGALLTSMQQAGVRPDAFSYTTIIALLAERRDPVAAEAMYRRAIDEGIVPDVEMIVSVMDAHVEAGLWQGVIRVFDYLRTVPARRLHLTIGVYNTLLKAYVLIGAPFSIVSRLFSRLEGVGMKPDDYTYTLLIQSACDAGDMDTATRLFDELDRSYERSHANVYVLTIILAGFLRQGEQEKARTVYDQMLARNIKPTSLTYFTILKAYANEGTEESLRIAQEFLTSLIDSDIGAKLLTEPPTGRLQPLEAIHLPLLSAYTKLKDVANAEKTMQSVLDSGGKPTMSGLTLLMDAYRRTGDINAVVDVWGQILELGMRHSKVEALFEGTDIKYDRKRQTNMFCISLSVYIDALSRAGRHLEIAKVWSELRGYGFQFDSHNWNHLTVALVRAGEPERAFEIVEKVIYVYRDQFLEVQSSRPKRPSSPLYFDHFEDDGDDLTEEIPASDDPMRNTSKRASTVMRAKRRLESALYRYREEQEVEEELEEEANSQAGRRPTDFAHPLHIMHQVSPSWDVWRPHLGTLLVLSDVLERLRAGKLVKTIKPRVESSDESGNGESDENENSEEEEYLEPDEWDKQQRIAQDIFDRIVNRFPRTVETVERFRISQAKVYRRGGRVQ